MKQIATTIVLLIIVITSLKSQSVGLVLSGGGAKGIAHIGLIKALEEKGIPIDYVTGTSMGAIVGGLYAIGLSPDEMIELIKSDNFKSWQTGKIDAKDKLYFRSEDPTPEFANVKINLWDSTKATTSFLPSSFINPVQMNLGIIEIFAQANAACNGDFNKLMVPFRCVASDVFHKQAVIHRKGDLGNCIRSSMTIPLVFKPIRIDGNLLYDGGIYNNFPTDIMVQDFNPDFIFGSIVASAPTEPDETNLMDQIFTMVMQRTNYDVNPEKGVAIKYNVNKFGLLEFDQVDQIFEIGYKEGKKIADSLQTRISRRVSPESVALKRMVFKSNYPDLTFKNVTITGAHGIERMAIMSQIQRNRNGELSYSNFRESYYKLLSDNKLKELTPEVKYNKTNNSFDLNLGVKVNNEISLGIGGLITSASANQAYLGLKYQTYNPYSMNLSSDFYVGNTYNSAMLSGRIELPTKRPIYLRFSTVFTARSYYQTDRLFFQESVAAYLKQGETYGRLIIGTPINRSSRFSLAVGYSRMTDQYMDIASTKTNKVTLDRSRYYLGSISVRVHSNTLNHVMYPNAGNESVLMGQAFIGSASNYSNNNDTLILKSSSNQKWMQLELKFTQYRQLKNGFSLGTLFDGLVSNKSLYDNYAATILQAPSFTPTPHSKVQFNESLRAMNYLAGGIMPIWTSKSGLQIRSEFYGFVPIIGITSNSATGATEYQGFGKKIQYLGELSLVLNTPIASIALYGNHYSYPKNNWNIGVNIGFLIMNPKFIQ